VGQADQVRLRICQPAAEGLGALRFGIAPDAVGPFRPAFGAPDNHEPIGAIAIDTEPVSRAVVAHRGPPRTWFSMAAGKQDKAWVSVRLRSFNPPHR